MVSGGISIIIGHFKKAVEKEHLILQGNSPITPVMVAGA